MANAGGLEPAITCTAEFKTPSNGTALINGKMLGNDKECHVTQVH